jgi:hypothetical protein
MARLVLSDKPKPRLEIAEPRIRRRITTAEIEKGLGAERADMVPAGGSPISAYAVRRELFHRLRSTGGRPALAEADIKPKIPMRQSQWEKLEDLARRVESDGFHPTPAQLASVILDAGIDEFERTLDATGNGCRAGERSVIRRRPAGWMARALGAKRVTRLAENLPALTSN